MARLILFAVGVYALVWLVRRAIDGPPERPARGSRDAARVADDRDAGASDLVRCAQCGVHLPRGEARLAAGRIYCSAEHARLGPKAD